MTAPEAAPAAQRLNIGIVVPGFSDGEDDWCIPALLNLVRRLAVEHDMRVYSLRYPHHQRRYTVYGAQVRAFGAATSAGWRRLPLLWRVTRAIVDDARQRPFSILHGLWADEAGLIAALAAARTRAPALVSLMGGELARLPQIGYGGQLTVTTHWLTRLSLSHAHAISAGSQQLLERASGHAPQRKLVRLPLGVDLALFSRGASPVAENELRVVHVASLAPVKDQVTLLDAFAQVRSQLPSLPISLHIAGDGPLRASLEQKASQHGLAGTVHFHGAVAHEALPAFYRQGSLFVLSSLHESQSVALLEAAACGLPAVGAAVGLLPELLPAACLAPPGDAQALAQGMVRLLADERLRQAEAQRLHATVVSSYGLDSTVCNLLAVYRRLIIQHLREPYEASNAAL